MDSYTIYDLSAGIASLAVLAGYHAFLQYKLLHNPRYSLAAVNALARAAWVEHIIASEDHILAVQTLRNSMMSASFMASTAILLIVGVLNLAGQSNSIAHVLQVLNRFEPVSQDLWLVKLIILVLVLLAVFFCFTMSIRLYNHVGYFAALPPSSPAAMSAAGVAQVLNHAGTYFTRGMRAYYFSVPVLFWLFGPALALVSTAVLIVVLWRIDRAPD